MTSWDDLEDETGVVTLDANTSDRLLAGAVAPADAPPGYADVASLLAALVAKSTDDELAREAEHVAMVSATVLLSSGVQSSPPKRSFIPCALSRPRIAAVLIAVGLASTGGLASAGALPGVAQDIASKILGKVGISVPAPNENAGRLPNVSGVSADRSERAKGRVISELATTTERTGVDKGATISQEVSDSTSQAGQQGSGSSASAPVATPNPGGTGTADTASDGKSSFGTSTANEASGGHAAAGPGNASSGQKNVDRASDRGKSSSQSHRP
jgi:hypothetical protein